MNRRLAILAVVLVAGAALAAWHWLKPRPAAGDWQGYVDADYVRVAPTLEGLLTAVSVQRGDAVAAGAPLFAQDDRNDRAARDEAAAKLAQAEAQRANLEAAGRSTEIAQAEADLNDLRASSQRAQADLARVLPLVPRGAATRQQLDSARADARSAQARVKAAAAKLAQMRDPTGRTQEIVAQGAAVDAARAALAQADWRLEQRRVAAPLSGRVAEVYARPGETMAEGAPVVSLLPAANILVRFFVPERALAGIHLGDPVAIGCDHCPADLRGTVSFVAPQAEYTPPVIYSESTRDKLVYLIEARPEPARATLLKPGQPVDVHIVQGGGGAARR